MVTVPAILDIINRHDEALYIVGKGLEIARNLDQPLLQAKLLLTEASLLQKDPLSAQEAYQKT